jgi:UPF0489 domain
MSKLTCYVVEDHCEALPHWHFALRKKQLPQTGITMLHFDAHPDLMISDMHADICFQPEELYKTISASPGGIAEVFAKFYNSDGCQHRAGIMRYAHDNSSYIAKLNHCTLMFAHLGCYLSLSASQ